MTEAYPLCWPAGYPRTKYTERSRFKSPNFGAVRDGIIREIRLLGGRNIIISTNIPLKNDGYPYATFRTPDDTGVAVYFMYNGEQVVFACDKWKLINDNMRAVEKAIEAVRGLERWGVSEMLKRAFTGFKALPEQASRKDWWQILNVEKTATRDEIKAAWRKLVTEHHPDKGGSIERFHEIQQAYKDADL